MGRPGNHQRRHHSAVPQLIHWFSCQEVLWDQLLAMLTKMAKSWSSSDAGDPSRRESLVITALQLVSMTADDLTHIQQLVLTPWVGWVYMLLMWVCHRAHHACFVNKAMRRVSKVLHRIMKYW